MSLVVGQETCTFLCLTFSPFLPIWADEKCGSRWIGLPSILSSILSSNSLIPTKLEKMSSHQYFLSLLFTFLISKQSHLSLSLSLWILICFFWVTNTHTRERDEILSFTTKNTPNSVQNCIIKFLYKVFVIKLYNYLCKNEFKYSIPLFLLNYILHK